MWDGAVTDLRVRKGHSWDLIHSNPSLEKVGLIAAQASGWIPRMYPVPPHQSSLYQAYVLAPLASALLPTELRPLPMSVCALRGNRASVDFGPASNL